MATHGKNDDPWHDLLSEFSRTWPPDRWRDTGVVVGVSGGADSVALLRAICQCRIDSDRDRPRGFVVVAHFNHALRGKESTADQDFVTTLAGQLGLESQVGRSDSGVSDESSLRNERLAFLQEVAKKAGARYVAVAHSADDNVETVLHHLMRGTGPAGIAGIRRWRSLGDDLVLARPLLSVRRQTIRSGLQSIGQRWREDSSNTNTDYRRNWIRHELIPTITTTYPGAVEAVGRAIDAQRQWADTMDRLANAWLQDHWTHRDPVRLLSDNRCDPSVLVVALQKVWSDNGWPRGEMSREHWLRLSDSVRQSTEDRYTLPGAIDVLCAKEFVEIRKG